ncbi:hypothetical protein [Parasphingorhabdus pacifica]
MGMAEVVTLVAAGVAVIAVAFAAWQLRVARRQARQAVRQAGRADELATVIESHAKQAAGSAQSAHTQAQWAWEQVKLASGQLEEAKQEHQASARAEQWEWAYALTMTARELIDSNQELIRTALDAQVAPHYRRGADRHYRQSCQRWQDTMVKALSRTSPTLEVQHQVIAFAHVHQRLHGFIDVLLRAVETDTLVSDDAVTRQVLGLRQELASAHRQLQRTVSTSLATPDDAPPEAHPPETHPPEAQTQQIAGRPGNGDLRVVQNRA